MYTITKVVNEIGSMKPVVTASVNDLTSIEDAKELAEYIANYFAKRHNVSYTYFESNDEEKYVCAYLVTKADRTDIVIFIEKNENS